jgi:pyruvate kinase
MLNIAAKKVKIIATLGPASESKSVIRNIIKNGADVLRLNFSHGDESFFIKIITAIREISSDAGIMIDLPGPKIRTGKVSKNAIFLNKYERVALTNKGGLSDEKRIFIDYPLLGKDIKSGSLVYIDDGKIKLKVLRKISENELISEVLSGGILEPEKGINFPNAVLNIPSVTDKDKEYLLFGAKHNADMFAVSFIRSPDDITYVKNFLKNNYPEKEFLIIAKIEKVEAVKNISEIAAVADAIMVARGDLGVEAPVENIPLEQKKIISVANFYKKPVITATQMLLSMVENVSPTRAEVTDISNAIFDGTDAVMLSEETAIGKHPVEAVEYMSKIIRATEKSRMFNNISEFSRNAEDLAGRQGCNNIRKIRMQTQDISAIIAEMAVTASKLLKNSIIAAITRSGYTANLISSLKPHVPVLALVPNDIVKRRLSLNYGVACIVMKNIKDENIDLKDAIDLIGSRFKSAGSKTPDYLIMTGGIPLGEPGSTDFVKIIGLNIKD